MLLSTVVKVISPYSGKSKFEFWNNICIGDTLIISLNLKHIGRGNSGLYSVTVTATNNEDDTKFSCGWNEMCNYLNKMKLQEYSPIKY